MGTRKAKRGNQGSEIVGKFDQAIWHKRIARTAGIALVVGDHRKMRRERGTKRIEHGMIGFRAMQQEQRRPLAAALEADGGAVGFDPLHGYCNRFCSAPASSRAGFSGM